MSHAARVAAEIKEAFGVDAQLVPGFLGVFDVHVNGEIIFSKSENDDRFPTPGEIEREIRKRFFFDPAANEWIKRSDQPCSRRAPR